ncbi:DUF6263 family protein [Flavitalea antarctica]
MLQYQMHIKQLYLSLLVIVIGCKGGRQNQSSFFGFQPDPDKVYQFVLKTVSTSVSPFGTSGDTTLFRFTLQPKLVDTMGSRLLMVIQELRLAKQPMQLRDGSAKNRMVKKEGKFTDMLAEFLANRLHIMKGFAGDSLVLFFNNRVELVMEDGFEQLIKNVSHKTGLDNAAVKAVARDFLSPAALKDMFTGFMFYLPGKHISQNDSWVNNTMFTALAPVKHSNVISVDKIENDLVSLRIVSRISAGGEGTTYMAGTRNGMVKALLNSGIPATAMFTDETVTRTTGGEIQNIKLTEITCITR